MIFISLLTPVLLFVLIFYCFPYLIGWRLYNIEQGNIYNYDKNTLLYIKKKDKSVKKNDLVVINDKVRRVVADDKENFIIREDDSADIAVFKKSEGISSVKFGIPKLGIVLSFINKLKKKVHKK